MQFLHICQYAISAYCTMQMVMYMYQRIRDLREDNDFTQAQIAEKLNLSQSTYSRYESGRLDIPSEVLIELSKFYKVSVDYLLGLKDK